MIYIYLCNICMHPTGNISVKTLLTILPTLSREYDQSYKSFNNVPLVRQKNPVPSTPQSGTVSNCPSGNQDDTDGVEPVVCSHVLPTLNAENLAAAVSSTTADITSARDDGDAGDQSDEDSEEGVGGVSGSCANKLETGLQFRGSRCFEVLGLDVMIDCKLNPWMIEVNHLPSFGTDSPLDLDIKERLMEEVFNCLPVLPDDELAFNMYHKAEAEKRLTIDRTTASITKMRDKVSVEKEKEIEREKERQERITKRRARDRETMAAAHRTLSEERARVGIPDQANGLLPSGDRQSGDNIGGNIEPKEIPYHKLPRIEQIKFHLKEIYLEKCPDKLNKIDRLLERYQVLLIIVLVVHVVICLLLFSIYLSYCIKHTYFKATGR